MMAVDLKDHLAAVSTNRTPLWIDAWSYGETLLNRGERAPWNDVGQMAAFVGKLQDLVASDVLMVEVQSFYDYWLQHNPALLEAMAEKRRLGYPLRTLLALLDNTGGASSSSGPGPGDLGRLES